MLSGATLRVAVPELFYKGLICACTFAGTKSELLVGIGGDERHTGT